MSTRTLRQLHRLALRALHRTARPRPPDAPAPPRHTCTALCSERPVHLIPRPRTNLE
ncbi:hypothetical protein OG249_36830 [Streptomyces microflavus]|uniref:hypothetical protein n=1 Tax=Streptomyces microflavus TaxID=1919 RepID=UPI00224F8BBA|nr:hypothetical protein [Streptomyces microflavus]MCX4657427.1 hypothetical protein [Streptomyces microflavus]